LKTSLTVTATRIDGVRTPEEQRDIDSYYLRHDAPSALRSSARALLATERRLAVAREQPLTMIMGDDPGRTTHVLFRGDIQQPGERVECDVPRALPALGEDVPRSRLGVARWLVGGENPLPPRVVANHYFGLIFGEGLVRTPDDFGVRGDAPTHPELL